MNAQLAPYKLLRPAPRISDGEGGSTAVTYTKTTVYLQMLFDDVTTYALARVKSDIRVPDYIQGGSEEDVYKVIGLQNWGRGTYKKVILEKLDKPINFRVQEPITEGS